MSTDIRGKGGASFRASNRTWTELLEAAYYAGRKPAGVVMGGSARHDPETPAHDEAARSRQFVLEQKYNYFTNDGQFVTADDAAALAAGIEQALEFGNLKHEGEEFREYVGGFIELCKLGGFRIL